jgi:hypothetical protein
MRSRRRGSALLTAVMLMGALLVMVVALLIYANQQRKRAVSGARTQSRISCAQAGLQYARGYFGRNVATWSTYLSTPSTYNPIPSAWNTTAAALQTSIRTTTFQTANPALFTDLDDDGLNDVFIYIRDNDDELLPAASNWARDNDQNVIVGAICISTSMVPRREDGTRAPDPLVLEGMLTFNSPGSFYYSQAASGANGDGNANR